MHKITHDSVRPIEIIRIQIGRAISKKNSKLHLFMQNNFSRPLVDLLIELNKKSLMLWIIVKSERMRMKRGMPMAKNIGIISNFMKTGHFINKIVLIS